jgi:hypothetical protein
MRGSFDHLLVAAPTAVLLATAAATKVQLRNVAPTHDHRLQYQTQMLSENLNVSVQPVPALGIAKRDDFIHIGTPQIGGGTIPFMDQPHGSSGDC